MSDPAADAAAAEAAEAAEAAAAEANQEAMRAAAEAQSGVPAQPPDERIKAAEAESERQAKEALIAKDAVEARLAEPLKLPHAEVVELLGDTAKPTGMLRIASVEGSGKRLQAEWTNGDKAAWFDVPSVLVDYLPEPARPVSADVWPGVPGSRRPSREA